MTDPIRNLLISLSSHMAYMQGQLEAGLVLYDPEHYYWYRESVLLRQKVTDALAEEPAVPQPQPPAEGEVAELVQHLHHAAEVDGWDGASPEWCQSMLRAADLLERLATACAICERERLHQSTRAADLEVERQVAPVPVPVSERLPGPEDCDSHGWCWVLYSAHSTWTLEPPYGQDGMPTGWTHWLPATALPLPEQEVEG